jgi:hypothetical protein
MSTVVKGGNNTAGEANVDSAYRLETTTEKNFEDNPSNVGAVKVVMENDAGLTSGEPYLKSPEVDEDYRLRVSQDVLLDQETFNYTAQNTSKHLYVPTTMTNTWAASGMTTNSSNITTTTTGSTFQTRAMFSLVGSCSLYCEVEGSFSNQPVSNTIIDFGLFLGPIANPYAPTDGAYFRLTSAGLAGIINYNGTETSTGVFPISSIDANPYVYTNNRKDQYIIVATEREVEFWINGERKGKLDTPSGQGQAFMAGSLPFSVRHAIVGGAASGAISFNLNDYTITLGGANIADTLGVMGNRVVGSYQGLSGGTMGSLASYANSANPTAAVPTNTTSTVCTGLGGQGWETDTLVAGTDGVIMSYQVPAGTVNFTGKRLKLVGIKIDSFIQTALTGGGYNCQLSLAFGHSAVSLANGEGANSKAPRRIALGSFSVASAAAALTQFPTIFVDFSHAPVYVNPGEFIAIAKKKVGAAPSAGVIAWTFTPTYVWE